MMASPGLALHQRFIGSLRGQKVGSSSECLFQSLAIARGLAPGISLAQLAAESAVLGSQIQIAASDTPTLFDLIEDPLNQVASTVKVGAEAGRVLRLPMASI